MSYEKKARLLLLPYAAGLVVLVLIPALLSFGLAFFQYDGLGNVRWLGRANFYLTRTDPLFALSIQNALALVILPVPLRVFGAFLLARLLMENSRVTNLVRSIVLIPSVIPASAFALAWLWILNPLYGPLNLLLQAIGFSPPAWLVDPLWAKPGLILAMVWQIGEGFLISLAALHDMPKDLIDQARADGATAIQRFLRITLPLLAPIILVLMFRDAVWLLQESFTTIWTMTFLGPGGAGGPYYATYTLPLFIYEKGFDQNMFGMASVALWVMYALTGLIIGVLYVLGDQWDVAATEDNFLL